MVEEAPGYQCPKCGCKSCEQDQFQARCGYTELYKALDSSAGLDVLDFIMR